jgi:hypothetical protein
MKNANIILIRWARYDFLVMNSFITVRMDTVPLAIWSHRTINTCSILILRLVKPSILEEWCCFYTCQWNVSLEYFIAGTNIFWKDANGVFMTLNLVSIFSLNSSTRIPTVWSVLNALWPTSIFYCRFTRNRVLQFPVVHAFLLCGILWRWTI